MNDEITVAYLHAARISPSRWATHAGIIGKHFEELKREIVGSMGNVEPIKVRPVPTPIGADPEYEIVFGHRRHQACLETGMPVLALIAEVSDAKLVELMCCSNRGHKAASAWDQAKVYRLALDADLYPSVRKLSEAVGLSVPVLTNYLALTRLPTAVVAAFKSPADIQLRWMKRMGEALARDIDGVLTTAAQVASSRGRLSPTQIFKALVGDAKSSAAA